MLTSSAGRTGEVVLELEGNMMSCTERVRKSVWMCTESVCVSTGWSFGTLPEAVLFKTLQATSSSQGHNEPICKQEPCNRCKNRCGDIESVFVLARAVACSMAVVSGCPMRMLFSACSIFLKFTYLH
jgi:hypothetical protein